MRAVWYLVVGLALAAVVLVFELACLRSGTVYRWLPGCGHVALLVADTVAVALLLGWLVWRRRVLRPDERPSSTPRTGEQGEA